MLRATEKVEDATGLEPLAAALDRISRQLPEAVDEGAEGRWLGHAVHPLLTDLPLGSWLAASVLDLTGTEARHARSARRLVATGILFAVPTAISGLYEWKRLSGTDQRNVAAVHAVGNTLVVAGYTVSWLQRCRGRSGILAALLSGGLALVTGYLGGHLSFGMGAGVGKRR